jgi:hypothetical protein
MTDLGYMIWFLATAAMTITVLTVGTLAVAELLPRLRRGRRHARGHESRPHPPTHTRGPDPVQSEHQPSIDGRQQHDHEHRAA